MRVLPNYFCDRGQLSAGTEDEFKQADHGKMIIVSKRIKQRPAVKKLTQFLMLELEGT